MKRSRPAILVSLILMLCLILYACGDSNMFEGLADDQNDAAQLEQVKQDLNDGNYDQVINRLEPKNLLFSLTEEETRYLASAYMGKAGFDTLTMLEDIAEEEETGVNVDMFEVITSIFDKNGDGYIPYQELSSGDINASQKIEYVYKALMVLAPEDIINPSRLRSSYPQASDDIKVQRGIYALVHIILNICQSLSIRYNFNPVPLTLMSLRTKFPAHDINLTDNDIEEYMPLLDTNLGLISEAIEALININEGGEHDLKEEFDEFLNNIGYSDYQVSGDDLSSYLNGLL